MHIGASIHIQDDTVITAKCHVNDGGTYVDLCLYKRNQVTTGIDLYFADDTQLTELIDTLARARDELRAANVAMAERYDTLLTAIMPEMPEMLRVIDSADKGADK